MSTKRRELRLVIQCGDTRCNKCNHRDQYEHCAIFDQTVRMGRRLLACIEAEVKP